jgi:hypothetical protein
MNPFSKFDPPSLRSRLRLTSARQVGATGEEGE